jgi:hypothetical protein
MRLPTRPQLGRAAAVRLALVAAASIGGPPSTRISAAMPTDFSLRPPDSFVLLPQGGTASSSFRYRAGNFRTGSTLTVEEVGLATLVPSLDQTDSLAGMAEALAAGLLRRRDVLSAVPGGARSEAVTRLICSDDRLEFEMVTPLVYPSRPESPELSRRTIVVAHILPSTPVEADAAVGARRTLLVLWGGAKLDEWEAGAGEALRRSAASFDVPSAGANASAAFRAE